MHHNFSESDFKHLIERKRFQELDKNQKKCCEGCDEQLTNGLNVNRASSSDSSPQTYFWSQSDTHFKHLDYNSGKS